MGGFGVICGKGCAGFGFYDEENPLTPLSDLAISQWKDACQRVNGPVVLVEVRPNGECNVRAWHGMFSEDTFAGAIRSIEELAASIGEVTSL